MKPFEVSHSTIHLFSFSFLHNQHINDILFERQPVKFCHEEMNEANSLHLRFFELFKDVRGMINLNKTKPFWANA